ncbi:hypothetical protein JCM8208_001278 [Rhodotorula glutinis]
MGNNPSTPQAPPGSTRSSRNSPRSRTVSLPSTADSPAPAQQHQHRPHSTRRRKPSIELPDVQPSPQLPRRKGSDRPPVVDEELDPDPPEGQGGSLRGALQGKADHVVYGPRRQDDEATLLKTPPALVPTPTAPPPKPAAAMAIPGTGTARPSPRTPGGGGPGARDGSLTNAGMGAIGASPLMDPDDTTHPGFGASARLTSAVLMSTENMPVVGSPPSREDVPGALAQRSRALRAGGSTTTTDSGGSTASGPGGGGSGYDTPDTARSGTDVRRVVPSPQTSFGGAASSILAPSSSSTTTSASYSSSAATATPASALPSHLPLPTHDELPIPHTASPSPPSAQPSDTVLAPVVPTDALPLASEAIPSGTSVIASPPGSGGPTTPTGGAFAPTDGPADGAEGAGPMYVAQDGSRVPSPAVLLPPAVFNAPVAAIPIPLLSVPSQTIAQSLMAAAVDLGAGQGGVPTLIKWKNEDGQENADVRKGKAAKGPREVFVTGTFAKGWKTKIELRKTDPSDFSALISLPPGPHRLKFIVDDEWKASKHLPVATDADGNLINYLQVNARNSKIPVNVWAPPPPQPQPASGPASSSTIQTSTATSAAATGVPVPTAVPTSTPVPTSAGVVGGASSTTTPTTTPLGAPTSRAYVAGGTGYHNGVYWPVGPDEEVDGAGGGPSLAAAGVHDPADDDHHWSQEIPAELVAWGEWEQQRDEIESAYYAAHPNGLDDGSTPPDFPPPPASAGVQPPTLPAQLEKGPLNHAAYVTQGSGDDNSILPKPDHSVINHLAASPIKGGFLSVGVTTRYKRKFVTIVYYKALKR